MLRQQHINMMKQTSSNPNTSSIAAFSTRNPTDIRGISGIYNSYGMTLNSEDKYSPFSKVNHRHVASHGSTSTKSTLPSETSSITVQSKVTESNVSTSEQPISIKAQTRHQKRDSWVDFKRKLETSQIGWLKKIEEEEIRVSALRAKKLEDEQKAKIEAEKQAEEISRQEMLQKEEEEKERLQRELEEKKREKEAQQKKEEEERLKAEEEERLRQLAEAKEAEDLESEEA